MSVDLKSLQAQLLGTFFEESFEGLDRLEAGLLQLEEGFDANTVNDIFRAAHSIKGAAGTFGFSAVTEFAHDLETLLDAVRMGVMLPSSETTAVMLESVDFLRQVLQSLRESGDADMEAGSAIRARLQAAVGSPVPQPQAGAPDRGKPVVAAQEPSAPGSAPGGWNIVFRPRAQLLELGNEPWRLVRELEGLGNLQVTCDFTQVPALTDVVPTTCYLSWRFRLEGAVARSAVEDVFSWVVDECELELTPLVAETKAKSSPASTLPPPAPSRREEPEASLASLRVGIDKIDFLMNMVGELVITQSMLGELDTDGPIDPRRLERMREGLGQLARNSRALQESVMRLRSMPISVVFNRFPRLVHDLSKQLGKRVELVVTGQGTELDKTVLEKLGDPIVHLVRNSLDHGLEGPEERLAAGKTETGTLTLSAFHRGGDIVIEVRDDGRGLDLQRILNKARERGLVTADQTLSEAEITNLIFAPGFSTAAAVTDVSGRGVGMDVVRRNVQSLGGNITVESKLGHGTKISLRLPLTLAIIDGQLIRTGERPYVLPLLSIVESLQIDPNLVKRLAGHADVYRLRDQLIPVVDLAVLLGDQPGGQDLASRLLVIVEGDGQRLGLLVDELQGQQQVVVKSLEANFGRVAGLAGATILGDGNVAFILDVAGLTALARTQSHQKAPVRPAAAKVAETAAVDFHQA